MGLFGKKKAVCPICGNEIGFLSGKVVQDGTICSSCEQMVRGQFDIEEYWKRKHGTDGWHREDYMLKTDDPLGLMTVEALREMISEKKASQAAVCAEMQSDWANLATVENCFQIAPKPLDVGLVRAKAFKNRIVATSLIASGEFKKGDKAELANGSSVTPTTVLDVIVCSNSSPFETELAANTGKHKAGVNTSAWIILDLCEGVEPGCVIRSR